jgi:hypothetical protein
MKKLVLTLLIVSTAYAQDINSQVIDNPRNTLITAIARNDYGTALKALEQMPIITQAEKEEFLEIADQMIHSAIDWHTIHHKHPEIGKDSFKAVGFLLATALSAVMTAAPLSLAIYAVDNQITSGEVPPIPFTFTCTAIFAGLTTYLGYKTVCKIIDSWMKPSVRLENALRIKDAILQYEVQAPLKSAHNLKQCKALCCCPSETNFSCRCIGHMCSEEIEQVA